MIKIGVLGGADNIGGSFMYIESEGEAIIVDCGMQFADELNVFGIQKIVSCGLYVKNNIKKIKGIFITHPHEDHIGGLGRFVEKFNVPIYAEETICEYIKKKNKFGRHTPFRPLKNNLFINFEKLRIRPFRVEHSALNSLGLEIFTKYGNIIHTGDFKLGNSYENSMNAIKKWNVKKQPLLLITESTNADTPGYCKEENDINNNMESALTKYKDTILVVATFASNVYRVKNIIELAQKGSNKIYIVGKNMEFMVDFLLSKKIINGKNIIFSRDRIRNFPDKCIILSTGCQGEARGGVYKLMKHLSKNKSKTILLSSSIIPGNEKAIHTMKCMLTKKNFTIVENSSLYHASGHARKEEIKCAISYIKPTFFMPIHGDYIKQLSNKENAIESGVPTNNIILAENNNLVVLKKEGFDIKTITDKVEYITNDGIVNDRFVTEKKHIALNGSITFVTINNKVFYKATGVVEHSKMYRFIQEFIQSYNEQNLAFSKESFLEDLKLFIKNNLKSTKNMPYLEFIDTHQSKNTRPTYKKTKQVRNYTNTKK